MKLMSLFDGSGGFPLAASLCGIEPVYAAEVEPYPIAVTKNRFPKMKHLGDVSKVKGGEIEPVDIITFGSPCQDMSTAGKRAGLKHTAVGDEETTRSGLFMEAIRIIKEMRESTNGIYPRFAIWENVPGAFSSNKGEDFRTVLEEFIRVKEKDAVMPSVPAAGWAYADCISGDGWSLAYRTFDAQYWGVPQRRRRIYLVADFRGQRTKEILFEREGLRGYFEKGRTPRQTAAGNAEDCIGADDREGKVKCLTPWDCQSKRVFSINGNAPSLQAGDGGGTQCPTILVQGFDKYNQCLTGEVQDTLRMPGGGDNYAAVVVAFEPGIASRVGGHIYENVAGTLRANAGDNRLAIVQPIIVDSIGGNAETAWQGDTAPCLKATHYKSPPCITVSAGFCPEESEKAGGVGYAEEQSPTLRTHYLVRRLTPTECARLQGFPSWWGIVNPVENLTDEDYAFWLDVRNTYAEINGKATKEYTREQMLAWYNKLHSDSAEYKMWGNGIALPNALYVMQGIAEVVGVHHSK
jgi:DNA (cytosine-5)-methyltransferase 1